MRVATTTRFALVAIFVLGAFLLTSQDSALADTFDKPSRIKDLGTTEIAPGDTEDVLEISPEAVNVGVFTVPPNKVLVITSVQIFPQNPGAGTLKVRLIQDSRAREYWVVPNNLPTQLHIPTGLVIAPGYSLKIENYPDSAGSIRVKIVGYIARDL